MHKTAVSTMVLRFKGIDLYLFLLYEKERRVGWVGVMEKWQEIDLAFRERSQRPYGAQQSYWNATPGFRCAAPWAILDSSLREGKAQFIVFHGK